jgi:hypothetical protein
MSVKTIFDSVSDITYLNVDKDEITNETNPNETDIKSELNNFFGIPKTLKIILDEINKPSKFKHKYEMKGSSAFFFQLVITLKFHLIWILQYLKVKLVF